MSAKVCFLQFYKVQVIKDFRYFLQGCDPGLPVFNTCTVIYFWSRRSWPLLIHTFFFLPSIDFHPFRGTTETNFGPGSLGGSWCCMGTHILTHLEGMCKKIIFGPGGLRAPCVLACAMRSLAIVITNFCSFFLSFFSPSFAFDPLRGISHVRNNFSPNILA